MLCRWRHSSAIVGILVFTLPSSITSNPLLQSTSSETSSPGNSLPISLRQGEVTNSTEASVTDSLNVSLSSASHTSTPTNRTAKVDYWTTAWTISATLSLTINVGNWELAPEKILQTLDAAQITVGKKQASALLEQKFTLETGSRINSMVFEIGPPIGPPWESTHLTWADVGEVVGEEGLVGFFKQTGNWHSVYFDVVDSRRGELGNGAVRKWYMLGAASGGGDSE